MKFGSWSRLARAVAGGSACCLLMSACAKTNAQAVASTKSCHAEIASSETATQCPAAHVKFHVSVADCEKSSGTFEYDYMKGTEGTKEDVHATGAWSSTTRESDHVENVPLSCDAQLANVSNVQVTGCQCAD